MRGRSSFLEDVIPICDSLWHIEEYAPCLLLRGKGGPSSALGGMTLRGWIEHGIEAAGSRWAKDADFLLFASAALRKSGHRSEQRAKGLLKMLKAC